MKNIVKQLKKDKSIPLTLALITALGIFILSSVPANAGSTPQPFPILPTLYHLISFSLLGFFILLSIKNPDKKIIMALAITLIYGILDEIHQIYTPLRDPSIRDLIINTIGAFIGTIILPAIKINLLTTKNP